MNRRVAFVHTNDAHLLPALVAIHSLRTRGGGAEGFETGLLRIEGSELDARRDGMPYGLNGEATWDHKRAPAFHYLRRRPPELMGYEGRAVVVDPDVFAVRTVVPLFERDMEGKAVCCRYLPDGYLDDGAATYSTGVMLLDCAKLQHWRWNEEIDALFAGKLDYWDMLALRNEPPENIGELGEVWNSMDKLNDETGLIHFNRLSTQPWSAGLPLDHERYDPSAPIPTPSWWQRLLGITPQRHRSVHPDPAQERLFFELLAECLAGGLISEAFLRTEIRSGHIRRDAFDVLARVGYRPANTPGSLLLEEFELEPKIAAGDVR
jgi:hypothetical protein